MKIGLIVKPGHTDSGVGRYVDKLAPALEAAGNEVTLIYPTVPLPRWLLDVIKKILGWDLKEFFHNYPIWISYPHADIYHFTSQNLATLLFFHPPLGKAVVTVHDVIPFLLRKHSMADDQTPWMRLFDRISNHALRKAHFVVCDSIFTMQCLAEDFGISPERMRVILLGINQVGSQRDYKRK